MKGILFKPDVWKAKQRVLGQYGLAVTRRVVKFHKPLDLISSIGSGGTYSMGDTQRELEMLNKGIIKPSVSLSRYQVGETVYIKEAHYLYGVLAYLTADQDKPMPQRKWRFVEDSNYPVKYLENPPDRIERNRYGGRGWYLRPPMFLKEKFARCFIQITDVRAERLWEITENDAGKEGVTPIYTASSHGGYYWDGHGYCRGYEALWDSINKEHQWASNCWVFRYEFKLIPKPVEGVK